VQKHFSIAAYITIVRQRINPRPYSSNTSMIYCFVLLQYIRIRIIQYKHNPPNFFMTACINMNRGCETIIIWWKINSGKQLHGTLASWNAKKMMNLRASVFFCTSFWIWTYMHTFLEGPEPVLVGGFSNCHSE
jgi:hypothetical protein